MGEVEQERLKCMSQVVFRFRNYFFFNYLIKGRYVMTYFVYDRENETYIFQMTSEMTLVMHYIRYILYFLGSRKIMYATKVPMNL